MALARATAGDGASPPPRRVTLDNNATQWPSPTTLYSLNCFVHKFRGVKERHVVCARCGPCCACLAVFIAPCCAERADMPAKPKNPASHEPETQLPTLSCCTPPQLPGAALLLHLMTRVQCAPPPPPALSRRQCCHACVHCCSRTRTSIPTTRAAVQTSRHLALRQHGALHVGRVPERRQDLNWTGGHQRQAAGKCGSSRSSSSKGGISRTSTASLAGNGCGNTRRQPASQPEASQPASSVNRPTRPCSHQATRLNIQMSVSRPSGPNSSTSIASMLNVSACMHASKRDMGGIGAERGGAF